MVYIIPNYSQQNATFLFIYFYERALHVSGGSSTHHQEQRNRLKHVDRL
jgi:hypothetical protein